MSLLIVNESGSGQRVRHRFDHLCVLHTQEVRTFMERIGNVLRDGPLVGSPIADEKVEASW